MNMMASADRLKLAALDFLSWWKNELLGAMPASVRQKIQTRGRQLTIRLLRDGVELDVLEGGQGKTFREDVRLEGIGDDGWEQIAGLMEDAASRVLLPPHAVFETEVTLPVAAARDLRAALELRLPLVAPLLPSAILWSYRTGVRVGDLLPVTLVMGREADAGRIADLFEMRGLQTPPLEARLAQGRVTLRKGRFRNPSPQRRQLHLALGASLVLLATIPLTLWAGSSIAVWRNRGTLEALRAEAAPLRAAGRQAAIADARRRAMGPLARQMAFSPVIDDIALSLPDTVFLESVTMNGPDDVSFMVAGRTDGGTGKSIQEASRRLQLMDTVAADEAGAPIEFRARAR